MAGCTAKEIQFRMLQFLNVRTKEVGPIALSRILSNVAIARS